MGGQGFLGEFELVVMLAVLQVGNGAYAVSIRKEIERRTARSVGRGSVYVTLDRLEKKGLLSSELSDPTPRRGGKAKRVFRMEPDGLAAIRATRQMLGEMTAGLGPVLEES